MNRTTMPETGNNPDINPMPSRQIMDKQNPSKYISIRFEPDGFYLYIVDNKDIVVSEFTTCKPYTIEQNELIELLDNVKKNYDYHVEIQYLNYPNIIVPGYLFQKDLADQLLNFTVSEKKKTVTLFNHLSDIDAVNIFGVPENFTTAINSVFGEIHILHHITVLFRKYVLSLRGDFVFVYTNKEKSDIIAMRNGKLLICNSYKTDTSEDLAYYVVSVFNRFQLNSESDKVYYINDTLHPQLLDATKKFISHCIPV
jgi:hypothetical protein